MIANARLSAVLALVAGALQAQSPAVKLEVTADARGRPVTDLRSDEIQVTDNGKAENISFFRPWHDQEFDENAAAESPEFSNRSKTPPRITVVVLNLLDPNLKPFQWNQTVQAIQRFEATNDVYFYLQLKRPAGVLLPVRALPDSEEDAAATGPWTSRLLPQFDAMRNRIYGAPKSGEENGVDAITAACDSLEALAKHLSRLPGRKSIVWVGDLPLIPRLKDLGDSDRGRQMTDRMLRILKTLATWDIGVYSALTGGNLSTANEMREQDFLSHLPEATDGLTSWGGVEKTLARAVQDTHQGYRIIYFVTGGGAGYHKIALHCTRRGVQLHARPGYDLAAIVEPLEKVRREFMNAMVESLRDATDIGLRVRYSFGKENPRVLNLQVGIDAADIMLLPEGSSWHGKLTLKAFGYTSDGLKLGAEDPEPVDLKLNAADRPTALQRGLWFPIEFPLDRSAQRIRVIVCDDAAQFAGSITIPATAWQKVAN